MPKTTYTRTINHAEPGRFASVGLRDARGNQIGALLEIQGGDVVVIFIRSGFGLKVMETVAVRLESLIAGGGADRFAVYRDTFGHLPELLSRLDIVSAHRRLRMLPALIRFAESYVPAA